MDLNLAGKRILITGSSSGIGEATAILLAKLGARVVVHGRRSAEVARVVQSIVEHGGSASGILGDLATDDGASQVIEGTFAALGGVDVLVSNAGFAPTGDWFDPDAAELWNSLYNVNVTSLVRILPKIVADMKSRGWGRIINLSSITGAMPPAFMPHYPATKAAILNQTVSLSKALSGTGITVNCLSPGLIRTPATEGWFKAWAQERGWGDDWTEIERQIAQTIEPNSMGRVGRPEEVANVIAFLASPASSFINGTNIRVDGGANPTIA
jgi:3-oxoacyl-[acyl-carrier protein] reductase